MSQDQSGGDCDAILDVQLHPRCLRQMGDQVLQGIVAQLPKSESRYTAPLDHEDTGCRVQNGS